MADYERLRRAWHRDGQLQLPQRREVLRALRAALTARAQDFVAALAADFRGRSAHESLLTEVAPVISAIDYALKRMRRWAKPQRVALEWPHWMASARLLKRARGVAGIISPSNYPLQLALMPLISAVSAGCRTLVKPSEATPRVADLLRSVVSETVDADVARVVCGGPETAALLASLPLDVLLFTGSPEIGRKAAAAAATQLTPTVLELGGKSAVLLDREADLARSAMSIMRGKLINAGQTCVAPDYVLVPRQSYRDLTEHLCRAARSLYPDPACGDYSAILGEARFDRLLRLEGAHQVVPLFAQTLTRPFYNPKLVLNPPLESEVLQQEIFGPLLPLIPYDSIEEAWAVVAGLPPALALYWFGPRNERLARTIERSTSAAISVNETVIHAAISALPFGGVGASGFGSYHGKAGFDAFTHALPVFRQSRFNLTDLVRPPYGKRADAILKRLVR